MRIVRAFTAGAGSKPNFHAPDTVSIDLDEPIAQGPNLVAPGGEGEFQFLIRKSSREARLALPFLVAVETIFAIPTNKDFGRRQNFKIHGKYGAVKGSSGISNRKENVIRGLNSDRGN